MLSIYTDKIKMSNIFCRKRNKGYTLWPFPIIIFLGIVFAFLLLWGSKTALGILMALFLALFYIGLIFKIGSEATNKYTLYFAIAIIPFPYLLQFSGRDALTITTLMIYFLFTAIILDHLLQRKSISLEPKSISIFPILILISLTISFILNYQFVGQSFRFYVANVSGILLYFTILSIIKKKSEIVLIIKIILFTLILQSGISFLQWKFPAVAKYLIPFGTRTAIPQATIVEGMYRATGTVWDYELLAEWFLVGSILSISLIYELKRQIYIFPLLCCIAGIIFTVTRSALLLLAFGLVIIFTLLPLFRKGRGISIKIILWLILGSIILLSIFPQQIGNFIGRLEVYFHQSRLLTPEAINRKEAWERTFRLFLREPTIFGKGLYNVESLYSQAGSFHSLYLTLLYKIGIFGLVVHAIFWLKMLQRSCRALVVNRNKSENWYISFFLFIAVILMLIDGIKIEYWRSAHTIQFAWLLYGLLTVSIRQRRKYNENTVVSQTSA